MVVAEEMKPSVTVSVSESESSDVDDGAESEHNSESDASGEGSIDNASDEGGDENASDAGSDDDANDEGSDDDANDEGSDDNRNDESSDDNASDSGDDLVGNEGWADSVAKILGSSKPKNKKTLVLSRAKKFSEIKKEKDEKPTFEVIGEEKPKVKIDEVPTEPPVKKRKIDKPSIRVKPNILEKDRERLLSKVATKGVVQLFNAVRNQQKSLDKEMDNSVTEGKKEKVLKKFDKRMFLDSLMGNTKSVIVDKESKSLKDEVKAEEKPKWNALRDDFMMGAKMKDWDKESVDE